MQTFPDRPPTICALALVLLAPLVHAQAPAPAAPAGRGAQAPLAIPNPNYVTIPMEITVNRPAAEVWKRVGKYCDIGEWLQFACTIISASRSRPIARISR